MRPMNAASSDTGKRIAAWRKAKGLSYADLADAVGVTVAAVYQWEGSGGHKTRPALVTLEKIVDAFGLTMEQFYGPIPKAKRAS